MAEDVLMGLNITGAGIETALISKGGEIIAKESETIRSTRNQKILLKQLIDSVEKLMASGRVELKEIRGIGIAVPGPLDFERQLVLNPPNVPALRDIFLSKIIEEKTGFRTVMDNDANCMALAEARFGAGKGKNNVICLTLRTGVGGGIVVDKKLLRGSHSSGGEIGHMIIDPNGPQCSCGNKGCLEEYVSIRGIERIVESVMGEKKHPKEIAQLANEGEQSAVKVCEIAGEWLGIGLANLANILDPSIIILEGEITRANSFLDSARKTMKKSIISPLTKKLDVVTAQLRDNSEIIGATALLLE